MAANKHVLTWVDEMAALTCPDRIVWIDGSEEQADALRAEACSTGEMIKLNEEILTPDCGRLAPADNVDALAVALREASALDRDAARQRAETFCSHERMVDEYEALLIDAGKQQAVA